MDKFFSFVSKYKLVHWFVGLVTSSSLFMSFKTWSMGSISLEWWQIIVLNTASFILGVVCHILMAYQPSQRVFKKGDVVYHKAGGERLTVRRYKWFNNEMIDCTTKQGDVICHDHYSLVPFEPRTYSPPASSHRRGRKR